MASPSAPLADYFWIAGIEHIAYDDLLGPQQPQQLDDTIAEDGEGEREGEDEGENEGEVDGEGEREGEDTDSIVATPVRRMARHSRQNSGNTNRLSTLSKLSLSPSLSGGEGRVLEDIDGNTRSNRSSATIRPLAPPNFNAGAPNENTIPEIHGLGGGEGIGFDGFPADFDFDEALLKFAAERENFLDDLSFSAGAKIHTRPPMVNPRTGKLRAEDADASGRKSPLRSIRGSIRRKMSFRDMNSVRKQPMAPRAGTSSFVRLFSFGYPRANGTDH